MADNLKTKVDKLVVYGNEQLASKGISEQQTTIRGVLDKISDIQVGGPSTQAQGIFTGWTMPLTYLNSTDNVFVYESATHNITLTGLDSIGTISGNGTKQVTLTMNVNGTSNVQTPFTITCVNDSETLTYNGIAFYYGTELADGNCLAVAQTLTGTPLDIGYVFIESASLPLFGSTSSLWNNVYSYQIMTFIFGRWNGDNIGNSFLYYSYSFNQPITIPNNIISISDNFLNGCYAFNQSITIPESVTSIGGSFLYGCQSFDQLITIPESVTSIGGSFLYGCYSFNQSLIIPNSVTSIGGSFLSACYSFNKPVAVSDNVTSISSNFLEYCYSFNQPITIPNEVTSIGNNFLENCHAFNYPLTIPNSVTSIGNSFLGNCNSFNQPLTIPNNITSIGSNFLNVCNSLIKLEYNASVYPTDNNSLSQYVRSKTSTNGTGILITGTNASGLKASLPDRTTSPYRKLVLQE